MTKFHSDWISQAGQDKWVCDFFKHKKNGYFLDIGAGDGVGDSNTWYLEKKLNWDGINIDAGEAEYSFLLQNRNTKSIRTGIGSEPKILFWHNHVVNDKGIGQMIASTSMRNIIKSYNVPEMIDYVSLDIEGYETAALEGWPWETHNAILWTIEHNLYLTGDPTHKNNIYKIMAEHDCVRVMENVSCFDSGWGPFEDWYVHKNYVHLNEGIDLSLIRCA